VRKQFLSVDTGDTRIISCKLFPVPLLTPSPPSGEKFRLHRVPKNVEFSTDKQQRQKAHILTNNSSKWKENMEKLLRLTKLKGKVKVSTVKRTHIEVAKQERAPRIISLCHRTIEPLSLPCTGIKTGLSFILL